MAQEAKKVQETVEEKLARLEQENAKLRQEVKDRPVGMAVVRAKVTEARLPGTKGDKDKGVSTTGRISIYGIQRFPMTLGIDQWNRLFSYLSGDVWKAFCKENSHKFSHKGE